MMHNELVEAVRAGDQNEVETLLKSGEININMPDESGETPLHIAAEQNDAPMIKLLLDHGADASIPDRKNRTPLWVLISKDFFRIDAFKDMLLSLVLDEDRLKKALETKGLNKKTPNQPDRVGASPAQILSKFDNSSDVGRVFKSYTQDRDIDFSQHFVDPQIAIPRKKNEDDEAYRLRQKEAYLLYLLKFYEEEVKKSKSVYALKSDDLLKIFPKEVKTALKAFRNHRKMVGQVDTLINETFESVVRAYQVQAIWIRLGHVPYDTEIIFKYTQKYLDWAATLDPELSNEIAERVHSEWAKKFPQLSQTPIITQPEFYLDLTTKGSLFNTISNLKRVISKGSTVEVIKKLMSLDEYEEYKMADKNLDDVTLNEVKKRVATACFLTAVRSNNVEVAEFLLKDCGADISVKETYGYNCLHIAIKNQNTLMFGMLVKHGALKQGLHWEQERNSGETPATMVSNYNSQVGKKADKYEMMHNLIKRDEVRRPLNETEIKEQYSKDLFSLLLEVRDSFFPSLTKNLPAIIELIQNGALINKKFNIKNVEKSMTALEFAISIAKNTLTDHWPLVVEMIAAYPRKVANDRNFEKLLNQAMSGANGHPDIVRQLLFIDSKANKKFKSESVAKLKFGMFPENNTNNKGKNTKIEDEGLIGSHKKRKVK